MRCLHVDCHGVTVAVGGCGDLYVTRRWCAEVMALRVLSSQVLLPISSQAGIACLGLEVLDCSSYEGVCLLQSKGLLGLQGD